MIFTVIWSPEAESDLATLWLDTGSRQAVTDAADRIERSLKRDPESRGESRSEGRRILLDPPLGVKYRIFTQDRIVRILSVWYFGKRK